MRKKVMNNIHKPVQFYRDRQVVERIMDVIADNCNSKHKVMLMLALWRASSYEEKAMFMAMREVAEEDP